MNELNKLPPAVEQARVQAKRIIGHLEAEHIDSWQNLIEILEADLETAKKERERWESLQTE